MIGNNNTKRIAVLLQSRIYELYMSIFNILLILARLPWATHPRTTALRTIYFGEFGGGQIW